jgi:uncharacterized protein (DUF697 family)
VIAVIMIDTRKGSPVKRKQKEDWVLVPSSAPEIESVAERCRRLVHRRALFAAGVAAVPIPGLDWVTDVAVLVKLIPDINRLFGLTPQQVERLAPDRRLAVYKAISAGGSLLVGKLVTRELIVQALKVVGVRLTTQQAAKYVPIAGQAISSALTYTSLKYVCEQHIRQCMAVSQRLLLPPPKAASAPTR